MQDQASFQEFNPKIENLSFENEITDNSTFKLFSLELDNVTIKEIPASFKFEEYQENENALGKATKNKTFNLICSDRIEIKSPTNLEFSICSKLSHEKFASSRTTASLLQSL